MPDALTAFVASAMLVLAIAWFVVISRAMANTAKVESFFFGVKPPEDPV
jgi:hypothetical protein